MIVAGMLERAFAKPPSPDILGILWSLRARKGAHHCQFRTATPKCTKIGHLVGSFKEM